MATFTDKTPTVTLADLLPEQGLDEVMALYRRGKRSAKDLKPVLAKYETILLEKGVLVDYLAYMLEHLMAKWGEN